MAELHIGLHAASQGDHTLQTMVFEPAELRLHLAVGELPSSAGPLRTLELAPLFRGEAPARGLNGHDFAARPREMVAV